MAVASCQTLCTFTAWATRNTLIASVLHEPVDGRVPCAISWTDVKRYLLAELAAPGTTRYLQLPTLQVQVRCQIDIVNYFLKLFIPHIMVHKSSDTLDNSLQLVSSALAGAGETSIWNPLVT